MAGGVEQSGKEWVPIRSRERSGGHEGSKKEKLESECNGLSSQFTQELNSQSFMTIVLRR